MSMIKKSPWILVWESGGCNGCVIEVVASVTPKYDIERFGALVKGTPRHTDIFIVCGVVTQKSAKRLKLLYEQMPKPKIVMAVGACGCSGGVFNGCYGSTDGAANSIPVDIYVPGCPPKPEAVIDGLLKALGKLEDVR